MNSYIYMVIDKLVEYGIVNELVHPEDRRYIRNALLAELKLDGMYVEEYDDSDIPEDNRLLNLSSLFRCQLLEFLLNEICDYAVNNKIIDDGIVSRDLFDTKIMGHLTPLPSVVNATFASKYKESPKLATDYLYDVAEKTNYIRKARVLRDMKWVADTEYGELDITINLSKPEKDPKAIAAAKKMKASGYPKCLLCVENEGYAGRINHPARQNLRFVPVTLAGETWNMQYSPYVYYNEHCIVFNGKHIPMIIDKSTFEKLLDFVDELPHYFIGSNADLPIVGGSILTHEHFQGGCYEFPMERAEIEKKFTVKGFEDVETGIVKWPMSVIRVTGDKKRVAEFAVKVLSKWRDYSDEKAFIYAETFGERHNTITPIARRRGDKFELDLVLRNNITTKEHPLGVYHPHEELHHIKKENIGLIEVMGLAVLPSRLKEEIKALEEAILSHKDLAEDELTAKHKDWVDSFKDSYEFTKENTENILKTEIGKVFGRVLSDAGVYKLTEAGRADFMRFIDSLS